MVKGDFHNPLDAKSVDISHGEVLDAQILQDVAAIKKIKTIKNYSHSAFLLENKVYISYVW